MSEDHIAQTTTLLRHYDTIVEITAIDLGLHTEDDISDFKRRQSDRITEHITPEHHPEIVEQLRDIQNGFRDMHNQLFIQAFIMFLLIPRTLRNAITYFARRIPQELRSFHWVVDAKGKQITKFEHAWSQLIFPVMYAQSQQQPMGYVEGGDYSYFERFHETDEELITRLEAEGGFEKGTIGAIKLKEVLAKSFKFQDSKDKPGLQLADIIANATQRALNGKLREEGWRDIGALMINRRPQTVELIQLKPIAATDEGTLTIKSPFHRVVDTFNRMAKSMWLDDKQEEYLVKKMRRLKKRKKAIESSD